MKITCETKDTLPLSTLIEFQGGLKIRTNTDVDKIITSIKKYGFFAPFFVWKHDGINHVLDGHGRLTALNKIAKTESIPPLPVVYVDCQDEEDARNKLLRICSQYGKMTEESVLDFMGDFNFDFDELQLPDGILEIERPQDEEYTEEELETIPEEVEPVCKLGDIWELGEHRLICGDSTEEETYKKLLGDEKADLTLTDPPYGIDYGGMLKGKGDGKGGSDKNGWKSYSAPEWDKTRPNVVFFELLRNFSKNQIIWGGNYFTDVFPPVMCWLVWDKGQRGFSLADGEIAWTSFNNAMRIKEYSRALANRESKVHPTQKPVEIMKWCFEVSDRYSKIKNDIILDPFGGSGSTLIACEQLNRKCRMIELDPMYCDVIIARWEQLTGKTAKKLDKPCKEEAIGS